MSENLKISVCVPYYNASAYIKEAIKSIEQQTYKNWELLVFNDGSTKKERDVLDNEINRISNDARIIDSSNIGLYAARCRMFDAAKGDIIISLDADDYLFDNRAFEKVIEKFSSDNCDMTIYNNTRNNRGTLNKDFSKLNESISNIKKYFCCEDNLNNIWIKAFKKSLFKDFPTNKNTKLNMCEDIYMSTFLLDKVNKVSLINEPLYYYRINENSIVTKEFGKKRLEDQVLVEKNLCKYAKKWSIIDFSPEKHWFEFMVYGSLRFSYMNFKQKDRHAYYDLILNNEYTKEMLKGLNEHLIKQMPKHKSLVISKFNKRNYRATDIIFWIIIKLSKLNS